MRTTEQLGRSGRRWWATAAAALVAATTTVAATWVNAAESAESAPTPGLSRVVLDHEHTDAISVRFADSALTLRTRADVDPATRAPEPITRAEPRFYPADQVMFHVPESVQSINSPGGSYSFIAASGTPIWLLPQSQRDGVVWPGWETESIPTGVLQGDALNLELVSSQFPDGGKVEVYQTDAFGDPNRIFSTADGQYRVLHQSTGAHVHASWAFTQPGRYDLTFRATATTSGGVPVSSDPTTYTFVVGALGTATAVQLSGADTVVGGATTLQATVTPDTADGFVEFRGPDGAALGHSEVTGGVATYSVIPETAGERSYQAVFVPRFEDRFRVSEPASALVTVRNPDPSTPSSPSNSTSPSTTAPTTPPTSTAPTGNPSSTLPSTPPTSTDPSLTDPSSTVPSTPPSSDPTSTGPSSNPSSSAPPTTCVPTTVTREVPIADPIFLDAGHYDAGPAVGADGAFVFVKNDDGELLSPAQTVFVAGDRARQAVPSNPDFAFLGSAGSEIWVLPQTQVSDLPWLGWNTQHDSIKGRTDGPVRWTLAEVDGPGDLAVYFDGAFGGVGTRVLDTLGGPTTYDIPVGASGVHAHGTWVFTEPGVHRVRSTFSFSQGGTPHQVTSTLHFAIGVPAAEATPTTTVTETVTCGDDGAPITSTSSEPVPTGGGTPTTGEPGTAPTTGSTSTPGAAPSSAVTVNPSSGSAGQRVEITVDEALRGQELTVELHSDPLPMGTHAVDDFGVLTTSIPTSATPGPHQVVVLDASGNRIGAADFTVVDSCVPVEETVTVTEQPTRAAASGGGGGTRLASGHFDFGPRMVDGTFTGSVKTDDQGWISPSSVVFVAGAEAEREVPAGAAYGFLGSAGSPIHLLPQTQSGSLPWLGWNTQHETIRGQVDGDLELSLVGVDGPGDLIVYLDGAFGQPGQRVFDTVGGPRAFQVQVGATGVHTHANWAFTAPGQYKVTLGLAATVDGQAESTRATLTFDIGGGSAAPAETTEAEAADSAPTGTGTERTVVRTVHRDADGNDCTPAGGSGGSGLASTGATATQVIPVAGLLLLLGMSLVVVARRRQAAHR